MTLAEKLKAHLDSITQEEFDKEWAEIEKMEFEGPTIEEYFNPNKKFEDYVYMLIMDIDKFHPDSVIIKSNSYKEIKKHLGI